MENHREKPKKNPTAEYPSKITPVCGGNGILRIPTKKTLAPARRMPVIPTYRRIRLTNAHPPPCVPLRSENKDYVFVWYTELSLWCVHAGSHQIVPSHRLRHNRCSPTELHPRVGPAPHISGRPGRPPGDARKPGTCLRHQGRLRIAGPQFAQTRSFVKSF